jgi:response regulator of citrate/malate metabolism
MDDAYRKKLTKLAKAIAKFQELEEEERYWLRPLLNKGIQSTLDILDLIADRPLSFEEIATELGINQNTVTQKLNSLLEGGYPLTLTDQTAFAETGRPRKIARVEKSNGEN